MIYFTSVSLQTVSHSIFIHCIKVKCLKQYYQNNVHSWSRVSVQQSTHYLKTISLWPCKLKCKWCIQIYVYVWICNPNGSWTWYYLYNQWHVFIVPSVIYDEYFIFPLRWNTENTNSNVYELLPRHLKHTVVNTCILAYMHAFIREAPTTIDNLLQVLEQGELNWSSCCDSNWCRMWY